MVARCFTELPVIESSLGKRCITDPESGTSLLFQMLLMAFKLGNSEFFMKYLNALEKTDIHWA
jgi:hypothetical protein